MDIAEEIKVVKAKQQEIAERFNAIQQEQQSLLKESIRLEGELRLLQRLGDNGTEEK